MLFLHRIRIQKQTGGTTTVNNRQFLLGMGAGLMVGGAAAAAMGAKKRSTKTGVGKTLRTMGQVVDSIAASFGK